MGQVVCGFHTPLAFHTACPSPSRYICIRKRKRCLHSICLCLLLSQSLLLLVLLLCLSFISRVLILCFSSSCYSLYALTLILFLPFLNYQPILLFLYFFLFSHSQGKHVSYLTSNFFLFPLTNTFTIKNITIPEI